MATNTENMKFELSIRPFCTPLIYFLFLLGFITPTKRLRNVLCTWITALFRIKMVDNGKR